MKPRQGFEVRVIAGATVLALLLQPSAFAQRDPAVASSATQSSGEQFPDSPGTTVQSALNHPLAIPSSPQSDSERSADPEMAQPQQSAPANASPSQDPPLPAPSASSPTGTSATQSQPQAQEQTPHEPLGTAAAESVQTTGVAASRPAGAAVAPAKQRRVRSILIKVGALAAAGVAIGTTMALSQGSPSRPPGTH